jgi:hypothetical protein
MAALKNQISSSLMRHAHSDSHWAELRALAADLVLPVGQRNLVQPTGIALHQLARVHLEGDIEFVHG